MRRGRLSYSKVRALTRVATPENERTLLDFACCGTTSHVELLVRAWRTTDRATEADDDRRRHKNRHLDIWIDDDGMTVIRGCLSPEVGAVVRQALEAASDHLYKGAEDNAEVSVGQRRADALGFIAETVLIPELTWVGGVWRRTGRRGPGATRECGGPTRLRSNAAFVVQNKPAASTQVSSGISSRSRPRHGRRPLPGRHTCRGGGTESGDRARAIGARGWHTRFS